MVQTKPGLKGELLIWRTKNQVQPLRIQLKDSICFKSVEIASKEIGPWTLVKSGPKLELNGDQHMVKPKWTLKLCWKGLCSVVHLP